MVYKVIGLMSGSSLDGLDIVYVHLEEVRGQWAFDIKFADCISYSEEWLNKLIHISPLTISNFLKLNTEYGRYLGEQVNNFIKKHGIEHQVHFISSHGHTVFHEPENKTTTQLGDGASIAAITGLPVVSDLRALDVALGGQGAPIVPIGDKLLFGYYDYWLNIGGIANITVRDHDSLLAFDICPANQMLNTLAQRAGKEMDEDGAIAASGILLTDVLSELDDATYYRLPPPKSLSNEAARELVFPILLESNHEVNNLLHTAVYHIADQVAEAVKRFPHSKELATMLVTGGGAFNKFLMVELQKALSPLNVTVAMPDAIVIKYKEALIMALIGALRWREETTVLSSVTGASRDSIGGALWMGHSYNIE
ncbi:MAG TPA: anhydro-N-acetylmuramic acid kinase [Flavipsychrobacter sp.]|nr:anhydro-N-acetylmuramic acid kinase [Flavipsychrobacter sp.]